MIRLLIWFLRWLEDNLMPWMLFWFMILCIIKILIKIATRNIIGAKGWHDHGLDNKK